MQQSATIAGLPGPEPARAARRPRRFGDRVFRGFAAAAAASSCCSAWGPPRSRCSGADARRSGRSASPSCRPAWDAVSHKFGALVPIYGTLVTALIAMLIAVPVSFGIALFLTEVAPHWMRGPVGAAIELLAGIPCIIYGMWGLFVFVPFMARIRRALARTTPSARWPLIGALFAGPPLGIGMLTAGIVLGDHGHPVHLVGHARRVHDRAAAAQGVGLRARLRRRWEVVWDIVLPYTRSAVIGGIFLGLGRALGETMAVTFVLGNAHQLSASLLEPGNSIAATIANEFTEADSDIYRSSLIALGFLLFVVTFIVLAVAPS